MKLLLLLLTATFCNITEVHSQSVAPTNKDLNKLEWLLGTWSRTNTKGSRTAHERWYKNTENEWYGFGVTMNGQDTAFLEKIKIVIKDGNIFYVADVPHNKEPVYFKFTSLTTSSFICENPQHDFPKVIQYTLRGADLKASISGNGKTIDYLFTKSENNK